MLIPEAMGIYFAFGFVFGAAVTVFILFLIGLLYGMNSRNSEHFCADEVDFDFDKQNENSRSYRSVPQRLDDTGLHQTQARYRR